MGGTKIDCFICQPAHSPIEEQPIDWSSPRRLCKNHQPLYIEKGVLLLDMMDRAKPKNAPLEGSLLGLIYNPVYVETASDNLFVKVWASYVAGGIYLNEDRFQASTYFEYWAMEKREAVNLLYAIHLFSEIVKNDDFSFKDLFEYDLKNSPVKSRNVIKWLKKFTPRQRQIKRYSLLKLMSSDQGGVESIWKRELHVEKMREQSEKRWPESFQELQSWLSCVDDHAVSFMDQEIFDRLKQLSKRRFAELSN